MAQPPPVHVEHPTSHTLSRRELEVLRLLVEGKSDREIAATLFISPHTVRRHVAGILGKLDVTSRTAAATWAVRNNIA
jgi:DNA-binding NarL/FixJ family response regulator